ncbi:uncharacterized protein DUF4105 [Aminobacter aminovorans]|uniref:Lnb N-terminal periplasmic domain-containing protein n=2 Tax=Aminobacter aminovorans TaxID=83263 RepID=A0A380WFX8_AMIAI|nr:DUF4105 domain-containing protein [Aminobacter aminovorans]TCS27140.1 uncharacterized protein DUF4105 [Aminobacter aminovorans]SUU87801.1 Uncharacterised protein [Aminobacter aminovorans]
MRSVGLIVSAIVLVIAIALTTAWAAMALWYRLPAPDIARGLTASLFVLLGTAAAIALFTPWRLHALALFVLGFAAVLMWWNTIVPSNHAEFAPDVARQVTGIRDGDMLTLTDVRDFEWRSNSDFTERWTARSYDLGKLKTLDLFMSYWAGPEMAHVIMSFGFEGGDQLAWSVEVRRQNGGQFSPIADLFKANPLVIVAADERDVVGVRSNVRGEDVQLYRLNVSPTAARALLLGYVADANALAATPRFYNSITTNCTTVIFRMMRAVGDVTPFDWRLIVNGYLPEYAYDRGALDTRLSVQELRSRAHIAQRALAAGLTADFSRLIREGVPSPLPAQ